MRQIMRAARLCDRAAAKEFLPDVERCKIAT